MPDSEFEEGIRTLYELDNYTEGQHLSQAVGSSWPQFEYSGSCLRPNQQSLTSRGVSAFESKKGNECADSPTLTTNSERSEITEASSDFNFLRGQHQLLQDRQLGTPQYWQMQQSGYNDLQLLQQQMMLRQLQELQRQQQLQQFGDVRQQHALNQFSVLSKEATGGQFSPPINGTPVHNAPQILRNWMQQAASPSVQGMSSKGMLHSQEQGLHFMGLAPHHLNASLDGGAVSNSRSNLNHYSALQGSPYDSVNLLNKSSGQSENFLTRSSNFGNSYLGDQSEVPPDLLGSPQGAFISKQGFQVKDDLGQPTFDGSNREAFRGNLQNNPQTNVSMEEINGGQDQAGWPSMLQIAQQLNSTQDSVPLDPLEAKILYNMDENVWDAFGAQTATASVGFTNLMEHPDGSAAIPCIQSGSWSALMQTAVAETSSRDTAMAEWGGLTIQTAEPSTNNQILKLGESGKQQSWVDNNLEGTASVSLKKSLPTIYESSSGSSFPGFLQQDLKTSAGNRKDIGQSVQTVSSSNDAWSRQMFGQTPSDAQHQGNLTVEKSPHQMNNGPHVHHGLYEAAGKKYEHQSIYQNENSNYISKSSSGHQAPFEQSKSFGLSSTGTTNVNKEFLPDMRGNPTTPEELLPRGDQGSSMCPSVQGAFLPDGTNSNGQRRLSSPSHKFESTGNFLPSQGLPQNLRNMNPGQASPDEVENQTCSDPPSLQLPSASEEMHSDDKSGASGKMGFPFNVRGRNFVAPYASDPAFAKCMSVSSKSMQASLPGISSQYRPLNQALSRDVSQQILSNPVGQQFPILEASPVSRPSVTFDVSNQDEASQNQQNVWRNVQSQQHLPFNLHGVVNEEEHTRKEMSLQQVQPKVSDVSHPAGHTSGELVFYSQKMPSRIGASSSSEKNLDAFGHLHNNNINNPVLHQMQAFNSSSGSVSERQRATPGEQHFDDNSMRFKDHIHKGQVSASEATLFSPGGSSMSDFSPEEKDGSSAKALSHSALQARTMPDTLTFGHHHSQTQSSCSNLSSNQTDLNQVKMHSWFKQYGSLRNGQMVQLSNGELAKTSALQFSFGNPPSEWSEATDTCPGAQAWASTAASSVVASQQLPVPVTELSQVPNQMSIMAPKKRNFSTFEPIPWSKEVTQVSKKLRNISLTAQDWARATNHIFVKVEDHIQMTEVLQPVPNSKRRILLTTQLMQQLFPSATQSILSADSSSNYDSLTYSVARLSLGDACNLASCKQDDILAIKSSNLETEDIQISSRSANRNLSEVLKNFVERAKTLENDFRRLERTGSVVDMKVELQELEKFAVINRFAKFHVRGQMDTLSSAGTHRLSLQRYVSAFPMPKNLPEGANCHSL